MARRDTTPQYVASLCNEVMEAKYIDGTLLAIVRALEIVMDNSDVEYGTGGAAIKEACDIIDTARRRNKDLP